MGSDVKDFVLGDPISSLRGEEAEFKIDSDRWFHLTSTLVRVKHLSTETRRSTLSEYYTLV